MAEVQWIFDSVIQSFFSRDYFEARERFRRAVDSLGGQLSSYRVSSDDLTIDVGVVGKLDSKDVVLVSSGLHGAEGFLGSAIQLAWLDQFDQLDEIDQRVVLVHALNPFGFANVRRWNEDNVDLNRNCFLETDQNIYQGSPKSYADLNGLLNPTSPPNRWDLFRAKAIWKIMRMGMPAIKQAVAAGQYDFPKGLFFGGHQRSRSIHIVDEHIGPWIGEADRVVHLDIHSGLGRSGECVLMLEHLQIDPWFQTTFPGEHIEGTSLGSGTAYLSTGSLGCWLQSKLNDLNYRFALVEYGTHPVVRVVAALRAENRLHFYGTKNDQLRRAIKAELLECFCPAGNRWRTRVAQHGVTLIDQARESFHRAWPATSNAQP